MAAAFEGQLVPTISPKRRVWNVAAAVIGNTLESFDILVYAAFVPYISANFFPGDPSTAMLAALGAYGTSFVVRPLGALFTGWLADRAGRRQALTVVSVLMFVGTALIALLPGYRQIGMAAPALLILARLVQGFAAGGEFGSATAYLAEQSRRRRGYFASWQFASQGIGVLTAALFGAFLAAFFTEAEMMEWAWRIPFMFGMLIGPVAYVIRFHSDESPEFETTRVARASKSAERLDCDFWNRVAAGAGLVVVGSAALYLLITMPTLATEQFGVNRGLSMWTMACAGLTLLVATPLAGMLGDRVDRSLLALSSCVALMVAPVLLFHMLDARPTAMWTLMTQLILSLAAAAYLGALAALLSDLFEPRHRSLGLAISYNVGVMGAGAFAPLIYASLSVYVGRVAPSYYVSSAALVSLLSLMIVRRRRWVCAD